MTTRLPLLTWLRLMGSVHEVGVGTVAAVLTAWLAAIGLCRVGIPHVNPDITPVARPMETLGTLALCLPATVGAVFLKDCAPWLRLASPRDSRLLRAGWLASVLALVSLPLAGWIVLSPRDVPRTHALALWVLLLGLSTLSSVISSPDLAAVLPVLTVVVFSVSRVVPFDANLVYNVELTDSAITAAVFVLILGCAAFVLRGIRSERTDAR